MQKSQGLAIAGLAASLTLVLNGCENVAANMGDISIRRSGTDLLVGVCGSLAATSVTVETRDMVPWGFQGNVLAATGSAEFESGGTFSVRDGIPGMDTSESRDIDFSPIDEVLVHLGTADPDSGMWGFFAIDHKGVPEDAWLHSDGRTTPAPCS